MKALRALISACALCVVALGSPGARAGWVPTNGPQAPHTSALLAGARGTHVFAGTDAGVFVSSGAHTSWTDASNGLDRGNVTTLATCRDDTGGETLLAGTEEGSVFISWNGGQEWANSNSGLVDGPVRAVTAVPDSYFGSGMVLFYGTDNGVFRSNSGGWGVWWWQVNTGLENTSIRALSWRFDGGDPDDGTGGNDVYAGTDGDGVYLSVNGVTWMEKNAGLTNPYVTALSPSTTYGVMFAGTAGGGVFRSVSAYGSWSAINQGLTDGNVQALTAVGTTLFVATSTSGVSVSVNDGAGAWTAVNTGLPILDVEALASDGTSLYAATSAGVFRRALSEM